MNNSQSVFVIGPSRPAVNVMTWSLGQHPHIEPLAEARWLGLFSAVLETVYGLATEDRGRNQLDVVGVTREGFYQRLGHAISEMLLPWPGRAHRWVAGSAEFSPYVFGLKSLFPGARFIYVERPFVEAQEVEEGTSDGADYQRSRRQCEEDTRACRDAHEAFGPSVVLLVSYTELVTNPEACLRRCLAFLDEPYRAECLRPLRGLAPLGLTSMANDYQEPGSATGRRETAPSALEDPQRVQALAETFHRLGLQALVRVAQGTLAQGLHHAVDWVAPPGATVLVVSKGNDRLLEFQERQGWHFPQSADGEFSGYYPAGSAEAIAHLEELRRRGAEFMALPKPAFWWLDYYGGLRRHLASNYSMVWRDDRCIIFALRPDAGLASHFDQGADHRPEGEGQDWDHQPQHSGLNAGPGVYSPHGPATAAEEQHR